MATTPQMRIVPAVHGWQWLRASFPILGRNMALWLLFVFLYWTALSLVYAIPYLGPAAFLISTPAFTLGFTNMARESATGRALVPQMLLAGFRSNRRAMLTLGGIYLVAVLIVVWTTIGLHGDTLAGLMRGRVSATHGIGAAAATFLGLYAPVMLAFWFAPPLVGWHGMSAGKALFFSFFAALRNWRAMLVYGVSLFAIWAAALAVFTLALRMFAPAISSGMPSMENLRASAALVSIALTPVVLAGLALQFISYYTSYRDVFAEQDARDAAAT
jgi:hypothetical protein